MRALDWSRTPLGPATDWPQSLQSAVGIMLGASSSIAIYWGAELTLLYNDAWRALIGEKHPDALGRPAQEVFREIWEMVGPRLAGVMAGQGATEVKNHLLPLNRWGQLEEAWFDYSFNPIPCTNGTIGGVFNIATETTGRVRAEEEREESEEQLRLASRAAQLGVYARDLLTGEDYWSPEFLRIYGLEADEVSLLSNRIPEAVHPEDRERVGAEAQARLEQTIDPRFSSEHRIVRPDGEVRWVLVQGQVTFDAEGRPLATHGIAMDVTERKQAEEALRESEQQQRALAQSLAAERNRLAVILENLPVGIWIADAAGRLIGKNEQADRIWVGDAPLLPDIQEYTAYTARDAATGKKLQPEEYPVARTVRTGQPVAPVELKIQRFDGSEGTVLVSAAPLLNSEGSLTGVVGINLDITERTQMEEALRESETRQSFLVRLGDALRTVVDPVEVQGIATRLLSEYLKPDRVMYAEVGDDGNSVTVHAEYRREGIPSVAGRHRLDNFGPYVTEALRAGRTHVVADFSRVEGLTEQEREAYETVQIYGYVAVPLVKAGRLVAYLTVHHSEPRAWTANEVMLIEEVAERTWAAVERARAEAALRASEEKYRTLFNAMDEGFFLIKVLVDEDEEPVDLLYLEANAAATRMVGEEYSGRKLSEINLGFEPHWYEIFGRVMQTGEGVRVEQYAAPLDAWYDFYVFPTGEPEERLVASIFQEITERKRVEMALRERERQLSLLAQTLEERVEARTQQVRDLARQLTLAEHEERGRIAEILHDDLQQQLFSLKVHLKLLEKVVDGVPAEQALDRIDDVLEVAMNTTRQLSVDLSPPILEGEGLLEAFRWLAAQMEERHGLDVVLQAKDSFPVPSQDRRVLLFQMVRELLFNIIKHAGAAETIVRLQRAAELYQIEVVDKGVGFDPEQVLGAEATPGGRGLAHMRERLRLIGGQIEIESEPGAGTRVTIVVPPEG